MLKRVVFLSGSNTNPTKIQTAIFLRVNSKHIYIDNVKIGLCLKILSSSGSTSNTSTLIHKDIGISKRIISICNVFYENEVFPQF